MVRDTAIGKFVNSFYIPIVPLPDGNSRIGRMWHNLLPGRWKEYYDALGAADSQTDSAIFAELMLNIIRDSLKGISITGQSNDQVIDQETKLSESGIRTVSY